MTIKKGTSVRWKQGRGFSTGKVLNVEGDTAVMERSNGTTVRRKVAALEVQTTAPKPKKTAKTEEE